MNQWQSFLIALQFLTIIPVKLSEPVDKRNNGQSLLYYPLVGFIIASIMMLTVWLLNNQSASVIAVVSLLVWIVLTGGLHIDGLADSADAWLGGLGDKQKTLAIMKDPASGPIAVVILILMVLIKWVMLVELIQQHDYLSLFAIIILARTALPILLLTTPYVRPNGIGSIIVETMPKEPLRIVIGVISLLALISLGFIATALFFATIILLRYIMLKRLGGTTGDTAGAMVEIIETSALMTAVIL